MEPGLSSDDARTLSEIFVKQYIRNGGVLASDFENQIDSVSRLVDSRLVLRDRFYRFDTLRCTFAGSELAKKQIEEIIHNHRQEVEASISQIPPRLLRFFVGDCLKDRSSWFTAKLPYIFFDWRRIPLADDKVWTQSLKLFSTLEKYRLSMRTSNYVSTRGGELRETEFAFPLETYFLLCEISNNEGLTAEESKGFRVAYFLSDIAPYITSAASSDVREFIWQKLNTSGLTEADVAQVLTKLSKNAVTSEWYGLMSPKMPFEIRDQVGFKVGVDSVLIKPSIAELLGTRPIVSQRPSKEEQTVLTIDDSMLGRSVELYRQIIALESTLRELVKQKLKTEFSEDWRSQIPSQIVNEWKRKERNDLNESLEPETELINYADFSDYAQIIAKFKSLFRDVFPDNERTVVELNRINNIGRRRVMHIRTISDVVYYNTMYSIQWVKDQLQKRS